jgi:hypothetical protein
MIFGSHDSVQTSSLDGPTDIYSKYSPSKQRGNNTFNSLLQNTILHLHLPVTGVMHISNGTTKCIYRFTCT